MNCDPRSDEFNISSDTETGHPVSNESMYTHSGVVMRPRGMAFGQCMLRSITVRRYVKPEEKGKGPTISMFMCENIFSGTEKYFSGAFVCFCAFELWQL